MVAWTSLNEIGMQLCECRVERGHKAISALGRVPSQICRGREGPTSMKKEVDLQGCLPGDRGSPVAPGDAARRVRRAASRRTSRGSMVHCITWLLGAGACARRPQDGPGGVVLPPPGSQSTSCGGDARRARSGSWWAWHCRDASLSIPVGAVTSSSGQRATVHCGS